MTTTVHVTHFFNTASPAILDQCDLLMDALLDREEIDSTVRDAAVSADANTGTVEVEVIAEGDSASAAEFAAVSRIRDAVSSVVRLIGDSSTPMEQSRVKAELITC